MAKLLPEFPTEWHQEAYAEGLEREIQGYKNRKAELETIGVGEGQPAWDQAHSGLQAAEAELKRVKGGATKPAPKKPAAKKASAKK